jgi:protein-S-isoprenylcysteine O-methyltransferase Ste14
MNAAELADGLRWFLFGWLALSAAVFVLLLFIDAPYGRYTKTSWGPRVNARAAWITMEGVSFLGIAGLFVLLEGWTNTPVSIVLGVLWLLHYFNRTFVYPLRLRPSARAMPITIVLMAVFFNVVNAGTNGLALFYLNPPRPEGAEWIRVAVGLVVFVIGTGINHWSDEKLLHISRDSDKYVLPRGGLFERVSCPNYLGEIIEWIGFAIAAGNLAAVAFAVWTFANLAPRARAHHKFYREKFPDMPSSRKALIPFVW